MSIFDETKEALKFDPEAAGPSIEFEEWGDLIPAPSLTELIEQLTDGRVSLTWEWQKLNAELTLRKIAAQDDTGPLPKIDLREEDDDE